MSRLDASYSPGVWLLCPLAGDEGVLVDGGLEAGVGELLVLEAAGEPGHQAQASRGDLDNKLYSDVWII